MPDFLLAEQNIPFTVSLVVMFGIALLEGVTVLFGTALSGLIDGLLPDMADIDTDIDGGDIGSQHALSRLLGWMRIGEVPVLILLVVFLTAFGLIGIGLQALTANTLHFLWPSAIAAIPALILSLPVVNLVGGVLARILPRDETDAVSVDTLVGRIATITIGTAVAGRPAEARTHDVHGTTHYLMVEPDGEEEVFKAGDEVLLLSRAGAVFKAIRNSNLHLVD
jgi:hypothetical protein